METLHSIFNLLLTENLLVTQIITAPTVFIEAFIAYLLITITFKAHYSKTQKYFYIFFLSYVSIFTEFYIPEPFDAFINYFAMFIFIKILFRENYMKSILYTIYPTIIFALTNILVLKPFLMFFDITYSKINVTPLYRLIYLFLVYFLTFLVLSILSSKKLSINFKENITPKDKKLILTNLLLGFFTLYVQIIITVFYIDVLPIWINFLNFISLTAYFFLSFYSLVKTMKLQITTKDLETAENYNKTLSILYDDVKAFKHDFDNMIFTIGGFVNTNDIDGLKQYYSSLEKECQSVNNISLLNPTLINNPGIYNLLAVKYKKAKEVNVEIQLEFFFDLTKLHMPIYDFSRMLGILLDNAIEAAATSNEKILRISFRDSNYNKVQIVEIENSYVNKNIDKDKIFEKGITEKDNHLGMGLWEVKQIINRNNNINLITDPNDLYFKQLLEIYY